MTIPPVSFSPYQYNFNLRKNNYIEKKQLNNFSPIAFKNSMDFDTVDGIIGNFKQGKIADCYILSALISLANTEIGAEILKNNIKNIANNSYEVTLPGAEIVNNNYKLENKKSFITGKYIITSSEIENARKSGKYSSGDLDVLIYELAFEKYREEVLKTKEINKQKSEYGQAGQYTGDGTFLDPLNGGNSHDAIFILTGKKSKNYKISSEDVLPYPKGYIQSSKTNTIETTLNKRGVENLLDKFEKNPRRYAISFSLRLDDGGRHAVSLTKIRGNRIYFSNPWNTEKEFSLAKDDLFKYAYNVIISDMQEPSLFEEIRDKMINFTGKFV